MQDIRQSPLYAKYMRRIGWKIESITGGQIFIKPFPLVGSFIKVQRLNPPIPFDEINRVAKKYRISKVVIEPEKIEKISNSFFWKEIKKYGYIKGKDPFSPSKTIHIDITADEKEIFRRFKDSKRRGVRKAQKSGVCVDECFDFSKFIKLKMKQNWLFGFLLKNDLQELWRTFRPNKTVFLLASKQSNSNNQTIALAGVILLFWESTAYYWQAAATKEGKKIHAPALLIWESIKLAKKKMCKVFDFEGVYDNRFPQTTKNWKGFTKFKEGFGGQTIIYPEPITRNIIKLI